MFFKLSGVFYSLLLFCFITSRVFLKEVVFSTPSSRFLLVSRLFRISRVFYSLFVFFRLSGVFYSLLVFFGTTRVFYSFVVFSTP